VKRLATALTATFVLSCGAASDPPKAGPEPSKPAPAEPEPVQPEAEPKESAAEGAIPNNPALRDALIGLWTPDASGSIPASAHDVFDEALLQSMVYTSTPGGAALMHQGNLLVFTDEESFHAVVDSGELLALPAVKLLAIAAAKGLGVTVHHEGKSSVFTALTTDEVRKLLPTEVAAKIPKPELLFDGVYASATTEAGALSHASYFRFYDDGTVIHTLSTGVPNCRWFNQAKQDLSRGKYALEGTAIAFSLNKPPAVAYKGELHPGGMALMMFLQGKAVERLRLKLVPFEKPDECP
jgi:hypothetical protein